MENVKDLKTNQTYTPLLIIIVIVTLFIITIGISVALTNNYWETKNAELNNQLQKLQSEKDVLQHNYDLIKDIPNYNEPSEETEILNSLVEAISNSKSVDITYETQYGKIHFNYEALIKDGK